MWTIEKITGDTTDAQLLALKCRARDALEDMTTTLYAENAEELRAGAEDAYLESSRELANVPASDVESYQELSEIVAAAGCELGTSDNNQYALIVDGPAVQNLYGHIARTWHTVRPIGEAEVLSPKQSAASTYEFICEILDEAREEGRRG